MVMKRAALLVMFCLMPSSERAFADEVFPESDFIYAFQRMALSAHMRSTYPVSMVAGSDPVLVQGLKRDAVAEISRWRATTLPTWSLPATVPYNRTKPSFSPPPGDDASRPRSSAHRRYPLNTSCFELCLARQRREWL